MKSSTKRDANFTLIRKSKANPNKNSNPLNSMARYKVIGLKNSTLKASK